MDRTPGIIRVQTPSISQKVAEDATLWVTSLSQSSFVFTVIYRCLSKVFFFEGRVSVLKEYVQDPPVLPLQMDVSCMVYFL